MKPSDKSARALESEQIDEKNLEIARKGKQAGYDVVYVHPFGISERKEAIKNGFKFRELTDEELAGSNDRNG